MSGQPLLYSSNASPREAFTTMSHSDSFFSHVPVSAPAIAYGTRSSTSRRQSYEVQAVVVRPLTGQPGDSMSPSSESSSRPPQGVRQPPRRTTRWNHLPPIPTIRESRESASEESSRDEHCLPGTREAASHTIDPNLHRRMKSDPSSMPVEKATRRVSRPGEAGAEGHETPSRGIVVPSPAPARSLVSQDDLALLRSSPRERTTSTDSSSSRFVIQDHPALNRNVVKPRSTYARPGRLISGQGKARS